MYAKMIRVRIFFNFTFYTLQLFGIHSESKTLFFSPSRLFIFMDD